MHFGKVSTWRSISTKAVEYVRRRRIGVGVVGRTHSADATRHREGGDADSRPLAWLAYHIQPGQQCSRIQRNSSSNTRKSSDVSRAISVALIDSSEQNPIRAFCHRTRPQRTAYECETRSTINFILSRCEFRAAGEELQFVTDGESDLTDNEQTF